MNAKYVTPLAETDEILAVGLGAHLSRAREGWEVMQSAKKADAAAEMTDIMTYNVDGGNDGKQGGGIGKARKAKKFSFRKVGAPPAEKMMQSRLGTTGSRAAPLPVFSCERDIFPC